MMETHRDSSDHLTTEQLSALVEGTLPADRTEAAQAHLVQCRSCREEAVRAAELIHGYRRKTLWRIGIPLAAAAAALVLFAVLPSDPQPTDTTTLRSAESVVEREGMSSIPIVRPSSGRPVDTTAIAFAWRAAGDEATYFLTLTRHDGEQVWSAEAMDTTIALPDSVRLRPGTTYFWYVDAMLASGKTASTGVQQFTTER